MNEQVFINRALHIAERAHFGQVRTGSGIPYITHPMAVAQILLDYDRTDSEVIAGILHDVIEDTEDAVKKAEFTAEILQVFGDEILQIVKGVTKISRKEDGNRKVRVTIDTYHYAMGSAKSHNVKIADTMHNLSDIHSLDREFAKKYLIEKDWLISEFEKSGKADAQMLMDVRTIINNLKDRFK